MSDVTTAFKRLFLRTLVWQAEADRSTLWDTLKAAAIARFEVSSSGGFLLSTSSKGHSVSYAIPGAGHGYTANDISEFIEELLTRYEHAQAFLTTDENPAPTDAQIVTEINALMQPVTSVQDDFSTLRTWG